MYARVRRSSDGLGVLGLLVEDVRCPWSLFILSLLLTHASKPALAVSLDKQLCTRQGLIDFSASHYPASHTRPLDHPWPSPPAQTLIP